MSATLNLAPTTDAVLTHLVDSARAYRREQPLAQLTFLLPSALAIRQLRRALGDVVGARPVQFYSLSAAILIEAGSATREMSDLATRRLVRGLLGRMGERGELTTFAAMLDKPGFIDALVEWLREMKTQGITSEQVDAQARVRGNARDRQLADLYARYQAALSEADCADADGLLWLAAEALERDPALLAGTGQLIIAGFDQFSPVQMRIVTAMAARVPVTVYLLWDEQRPGNSLVLARLAPTRQSLLEKLKPEEKSIPGASGGAPALEHVRRAMFERMATTADDARCIAAVAAPSPEAEVRHALRRIKRLLLDGVQEEQVALLTPHPGAYRSIVATASREYGIPVVLETTLGENPCVSALLNLLTLAPAFPWRQTFDALRSPYVRQPWLSDKQIALLETLTRERPVVAGREQWLYALEQPKGAGGDEETDDEDRGEMPLVGALAAETVEALRAGLIAFFDHVTPPPGRSPVEYIAWIQDAVLGLSADPDEETAESPRESLGMVEAAGQGEWSRRDMRAVNRLLRALREWLDAGALVADLRLDADDEVEDGRRWRELLEWLPTVLMSADHQAAAIRFGPLESGRAVTVDHLFVLGLAEGEFPRPPRPDPLYTAAERASHPLPLIRISGAEDASLWWQALSNCQRSLTLLRPRFDANGAEWLPSPYWDAVVGLIDGLQGRIEAPRLSARPAIAEAACAGEVLEALACAGARGAPPEISGAWRAVMAARTVAAERGGWKAPAGHEGVLQNAAVGEDLGRRFGPGRTWSVSRLNKYGVCPYAFWAQYALKLEAVADPGEGLDAQQRGSLIHKLLEVLFARLGAEGIAPGPEAAERIAALVEEICDGVLPGAGDRYGFRPGPLWEREQRELRNELRAYMAWECHPAQAGAFKPFRQELKFGVRPIGDGYGAVAIAGLEDGSIYLHGIIDRIDRDGAGRLRVIDYKTGSKPFSDKDIGAGRALQSALYALAVSELMPKMGEVLEAAYRHTGSRKQSGVIRCSSDEGGALIQAAAATAVRFAGAASNGWFAALPSRGGGGNACGETCDFLGLCRVTRHSARKAQRYSAPFAAATASETADEWRGGEA